MPRHNVEKALTDHHGGTGPIYAAMLDAEERRQQQWGDVGGMRRPDHVLAAMRRGDPVEVYVSLIPIPRELREQRGWRMGDRVVLTPDM